MAYEQVCFFRSKGSSDLPVLASGVDIIENHDIKANFSVVA